MIYRKLRGPAFGCIFLIKGLLFNHCWWFLCINVKKDKLVCKDLGSEDKLKKD